MEEVLKYFQFTGFANVTWGHLIMIAIGCIFIYLAIKKDYEPLLLVPIGFGILIGNIPIMEGLRIGIYENGSVMNYLYFGVLSGVYPPLIFLGIGAMTDFSCLISKPKLILLGAAAQIGIFATLVGAILVGINFPIVGLMIPFEIQEINNALMALVAQGFSLTDPQLLTNPEVLTILGAQGLNLDNPALMNMIEKVVALKAEGVGLGSAAAIEIYKDLGLDPDARLLRAAAAIGIIGGADGPTAIFLSSQLAPDLLGAIAISAYSYMALVPVIQPPIMRLLTSKEERLIRMAPPPPATKLQKILFPIVGMLVCLFIAPGALPLLGMLFFGNLLKESGVTERLARTARNPFIDTVTILLGLTVGASTQATVFLKPQSIVIFIMGALSFMVATASGVLFAKLMNRFSKEKINPLIGAAGVSAVPDSARVAHAVGQEEDPNNYLIMHAMGPNVAGVIGSAVGAGVLLAIFR